MQDAEGHAPAVRDTDPPDLVRSDHPRAPRARSHLHNSRPRPMRHPRWTNARQEGRYVTTPEELQPRCKAAQSGSAVVPQKICVLLSSVDETDRLHTPEHLCPQKSCW